MADTHSSKNRDTVPVHYRGLIGAQLTHAVGCLDRLRKLQGTPLLYNRILRLPA